MPHELLEHPPGGLGHPSKIPAKSQILSLETRGKQTFEGGHELFDPHPFTWKTPHPTRQSPGPKIFVLFCGENPDGGPSNGGLRPLAPTQSSAIVHICGLLGLFVKRNVRRKMTTIVGTRGQFGLAFFAFFLPLSPFSGGRKGHLENPENRGKRPFFLRYPQICLNPHLLNTHLRRSKKCWIKIRNLFSVE